MQIEMSTHGVDRDNIAGAHEETNVAGCHLSEMQHSRRCPRFTSISSRTGIQAMCCKRVEIIHAILQVQHDMAICHR